MKLKTTFLLLIFLSFISKVLAADYYTASASATLAGNTGTVNANWTTNPDGLTGLATVTIAATDNLIILNGGTATITAGTIIGDLTIKQGGTIIHNNNATASTFNINGTLIWNGTIKTLQAVSGSNTFSANGDVLGITAIHDNASTRGVYLGGIGKNINLIQLNTGVINKVSQSIGLVLSKSRTLSGNCKFYSPVLFVNATQTNPVILDLAGFNLQVSSIKQGSNQYNLIKGSAASNLTISGTTGLLSTDTNNTTVINFDSTGAVLNQLNLDNTFLATAAGNVYVNGNLTVNSLQFGASTGDKTTRILSIGGNFTLNNNGIMRAQTKGSTTSGTDYDQLSVAGSTNIGTSTTLKVDFTNTYTPQAGSQFNLVQSTGALTGTFGTIQTPSGYTASVNYPVGKVQYQVLNSPPPTPQCSYSQNPDLPLVASNPTVEAEIETIYQRFSDGYLGTTEPTTAALDAAVASYNALGITVNGYNITATVNVTDYDQASFLKTFAQYLKFHPEDTNNIYTKALNTIWLVSDRVCKGTLPLDPMQYSYRNFVSPAILIPGIKNNSYVKSLFENVLYQQNNFDYIWEPNMHLTNVGHDIDHVGNSGFATLAYVKWIDSADERFRYMTAFKRQMETFMSYSAGTQDGLKPDGSGFHHWTAYPSYMYNLNTQADIIYNLRETSFEVSSAFYLRLRDALMAQLMITNDNTTRFLTMTGRKPEEVATTISRYAFRNMAVAGGGILGTGSSDPIMSSMYVRLWGGYAPFGNGTKAPFNEGYFQLNHSMAGIYRKNGWLAVCKGFNNNMFGAEIYDVVNRFGRYQSYGAVNIVYPGDAATGNGYDVTTWNWNYNPGTTVIRLPWDKLHAERKYQDQLQQKRFVGSLSFVNKNSNYLKAIEGTYGMFAMDFQEQTGLGWGDTYSSENHNSTFTFKKSVFTFDNMLICLGSNISNNDATNSTLTTLYQRKAITGKEAVNVDSNLLPTTDYDNTYGDTNNHWIVDNFGTGFYVFAGSGTIKLTKANQQTPQQDKPIASQNVSTNPTGNYATGYIDHGTAPSNKGYEYVCVPQATATDMTNLDSQIGAGSKPYTVHRKDNIAHIVEYKPTATANSIFGYAFFNALSGINNAGQLTGADYPCLVMSQYDSVQKSLKIAVNNPDLGFASRDSAPSVDKQINITIKGTNWAISQPNSRAAITGTANGETTIQFTVVDGLPVEITLNRVLSPQTITFNAIPTKRSNDPAFNLTATASSGLVVSYTSSDTGVATISGSMLTIVGEGTSTITASQAGDDIYGTATAVEQVLTVNALPTIAITSPVNSAVVGAPASITITADAADADGTISKVEFYQGDTKLGEALSAPFSFDWTNVPAGTYAITAKAVDNNDAVTTAEVINFKVNALPTIAITSPVNNAVFHPSASISITADAADTDGTISKAEFYQGNTKLGEVLSAPYSFDWTNVEVGSYTITVKATDNDGAVATAEVKTSVHCLPIQLTIPDVYAMNPAVDQKNTIYNGYGPSSLIITTENVGGRAPFTYHWSTGEFTKSITVNKQGTYTVEIFDANGCSATAFTTINILDVTCGNNNDKVMVCHNGKAICVSSSAVQTHLDHGDKLGSCTTTSRISKEVSKEKKVSANDVTFYPNPVKDILTITINGLQPGTAVRLYNVNGLLVKSQKIDQNAQTISMVELASGVYFAHVENGGQVIIKIIVKQ